MLWLLQSLSSFNSMCVHLTRRVDQNIIYVVDWKWIFIRNCSYLQSRENDIIYWVIGDMLKIL